MTRRARADAAALAAYLEGEVTGAERADLEAELTRSASARRTLDELRNLRELLAAPAPAVESLDLVARVRFAARQPSPPRFRGAKRALAWSLSGLAACLGCCWFFVTRPDAGDADSAFRAKANGVLPNESQRWAGIQVFRLGKDGTPEPLGHQLASHDDLLFSYTNLGPRPFGYLMIFAVDGSAQVRWFYPAYEEAGQNPRAVSIAPGVANVHLAELLEQDLSAGEISFYGLFTPQPLSVLEVEAWLDAHPRSSGAGPVAGSVLQRIDARVVR